MSRLSPASRLLKLLGFWAVLALVMAGLPLFEQAWVADVVAVFTQLIGVGLVLSLVLVLWDLRQLFYAPPIRVKRDVTKTLPVNGWSEVSLVFHHQLASMRVVEVFDHHPVTAEIEYLPQSLELRPGQSCSLTYRLRPGQRGLSQFGQTQVVMPSPLGFWRRSYLLGQTAEVRVYPDFAAMAHYQLLATDNHTSQLGIKRQPRRGEGLEFHQLRDYRPGDTLRQVDWKATIRRDKLISREYQDERDQQIFFMLDCGRGMRAQDGHLSHFDHALNALLLLSYVALKQGDAVGLMSFAGPRRWLPPVKSSRGVNTILNGVFDLQPTTEPSDYASAGQAVLKRQSKRSLLILMTNLREEAVDELLPVLKMLRRKHLVLVANLREPMIDEVLHAPVNEVDDALAYLGASHYQAQRRGYQRRISQQGALCLDVTPDQLGVAVVNSYWAIKRSGGL